MFQLKLLLALTFIWFCSNNIEEAVADPQDYPIINQGCSPYNTNDVHNFFANINDTISELRADINNQSKHFGTANTARGEILTYAMFQCRNYLSKNDCLACFNTASTTIRNCSNANAVGAILVYDGCFLRYDSERFYDETIELGGGIQCGSINISSANISGFVSVGQKVLMDLQTATPKTKKFYAATKTQVMTGGNTSIYAIAQCVETATDASVTIFPSAREPMVVK